MLLVLTTGLGCGTAAEPTSEEWQVVQAVRALASLRETFGHESFILTYEQAREIVKRYGGAQRELTAHAKKLHDVSPGRFNAARVVAIRLLEQESEGLSYMELMMLTKRPEYEELAYLFFATVDREWPGLLAVLRRIAEAEQIVIDFVTLELSAHGTLRAAEDSAPVTKIVIPPSATQRDTSVSRPIIPSKPPTPAGPKVARTADVARIALGPSLRAQKPASDAGRLAPVLVPSPATIGSAEVAGDIETAPPDRVVSPSVTRRTARPSVATTVTSGGGGNVQSDTLDDTSAMGRSPASIDVPEASEGYVEYANWTQSPVIVAFRDWLGMPALVTHWILHAAAHSRTVLEYTLPANDGLQVDIIVTAEGHLASLSRFAVLSEKTRIVPPMVVNGHHRFRELPVVIGKQVFLFDNFVDGRSKRIHLLVTHRTREARVRPKCFLVQPRVDCRLGQDVKRLSGPNPVLPFVGSAADSIRSEKEEQSFPRVWGVWKKFRFAAH